MRLFLERPVYCRTAPLSCPLVFVSAQLLSELRQIVPATVDHCSRLRLFAILE